MLPAAVFRAASTLRVHGPVGRLDLFRGGLQVGHGQIGLELPVLPEGFGVALGAQGRQDGGHDGQDFAHVHLGTAEDGLPPRQVKFLQVFYLQTCHAQAPPFDQKFNPKKLYRIVKGITNLIGLKRRRCCIAPNRHYFYWHEKRAARMGRPYRGTANGG